MILSLNKFCSSTFQYTVIYFTLLNYVYYYVLLTFVSTYITHQFIFAHFHKYINMNYRNSEKIYKNKQNTNSCAI